MDLRHLRQFVAVAEELHFGRAAERLNMTQPPLSQAIRALEDEIGEALFVRTKRSVALTPVGAQWLAHVRALLADATALPEIARRLGRGETGSLRLAFVSTADYNVVPDLVHRYTARFPDVRVALREATSDVQIAALLDGTLDAGIIIPPPREALHVSLAYRRLFDEPLIAAVPEIWLHEGRVRGEGGILHPRDLADLPLVLFPRPVAPTFHDLVTGYFATHGIEPRFGQQAIQMQTLISLVSVGMGITLVAESARRLAREGVRYLALADDPPRIETGLAWRRDDALPTLRRLVELVSERP